MPKSIDPIVLFNELELNPDGQIENLWPCQSETLTKYYETMLDDKRVAIELPTGSGKSIVALLLLEMWRQSGKRVGILVSSKELGKDMIRRCNDLGLNGCIIYGKDDKTVSSRDRFRNIRNYQRMNSIGIFNYWAYLRGTDIPTADVLIIDDADNFSNLLYDEYSIKISKEKNEDIYLQLVRYLKDKPIYQRIEQFEIESYSQHSQLVYFPHVLEAIALLRKLIHANNSSKFLGDLYWDYDRNGDKIETYLMLIKSDEIVFTPHVIPGEISKIRDVERVIFMSATLGSNELLHKSMGAFDEISTLKESDLSSDIGTMGKRIIFPLTGGATSRQSFNEIFPKVLQIVSKFRKAIVLCNSFTESETLQDFLHIQGFDAWLYVREMSGEHFAQLSEGVLIIAGRLIGIDFPDDACRIEIITKMPFYKDIQDIIARDILDDTNYMIEKTSQRLVQAFGRCNRSPDDYAAYFVIDGRLAADALGDERYIRYFPRRMKAELEYGLENTITEGLDSAVSLAERMLNNSIPNFDEEILELSKSVSVFPEENVNNYYLNEVKAWYNLSTKKNYLEAVKEFEYCINAFSDDLESVNKRKKAWFCYLASMSYYLAWIYFSNDEYRDKSRGLLEESMKYGDISWFSGLQLIINELDEVDTVDETLLNNINIQTTKENILRSHQEYIRDNASRKRTPRESWEMMRTLILKGSHSQIQSELQKVFMLMGFEVRTMRRKNGEPDLLLFSGVGERKYMCIVEIKSKEKEKGMVIADNINQISGNIQKYRNEYPDYDIYPLLFTNKDEVHELAQQKSVNSVRILKAPEFASFMINYYDLIERSSNITSMAQKFALFQNIPTPLDYIPLFTPQEKVLVTLDDYDQILGH